MPSQAIADAASKGASRLQSRSVYLFRDTNYRRLFVVMAGVVLIIFGWQVLHSYVVHPLLLPSPAQVLKTLWGLLVSGELLEHISASMTRIAIGYSGGCILGIALGLLMGRILWVNDLLSPFLELLRPLSPVAMLPLVLIWFGIGEFAKVFLVGYTAVIIVLINTIAGVSSMPILRERSAACLGASNRQIFFHVVLPSAVPHIVTGMRAALGFSFMAIVAAELIAAESGLGFLIMQSRIMIQVDQVFVGLLALSVLGALSDLVFRATLSRLSVRFQQDIYNV